MHSRNQNPVSRSGNWGYNYSLLHWESSWLGSLGKRHFAWVSSVSDWVFPDLSKVTETAGQLSRGSSSFHFIMKLHTNIPWVISDSIQEYSTTPKPHRSERYSYQHRSSPILNRVWSIHCILRRYYIFNLQLCLRCMCYLYSTIIYNKTVTSVSFLF